MCTAIKLDILTVSHKDWEYYIRLSKCSLDSSRHEEFTVWLWWYLHDEDIWKALLLANVSGIGASSSGEGSEPLVHLPGSVAGPDAAWGQVVTGTREI